MISTGTGLALLGTLSLTLPSVFSIPPYYNEHLPFLTSEFIKNNLLLAFQVNPKTPHPKLVSPPFTLITHMFHHADLPHFINNFISIVKSAYFLDLGFFKTMLLLVGGSVAGAFTHILEWGYYRNPFYKFGISSTEERIQEWVHLIQSNLPDSSKLSNSSSSSSLPSFIDTSSVHQIVSKVGQVASKHIPKIERTFVLCGASAGGFSLLGAETVYIWKEFWRTWNIIRQSRKVIGHPELNKLRQEQLLTRMIKLMVMAFVQTVTVWTQIVAMSSEKFDLFDVFDVWGQILNGTSQLTRIGYSAHLGGFAFGVIMGSMIS